MSKEEKNIFQNFIKKVSEFSKSNLHNSTNEEDKKYNKNIENNYKIKDIDNPNVSEGKANYERRIQKDFILKNPIKNKNKDKIFNSNFNIKPIENIKEEENKKLIKCFQNYQKENEHNKNIIYTNPFLNSRNNLFTNDDDKTEPLYHNSINYYNDQNDNTNDDTTKFLEISKTSNNEDEYNQKYSSDSYIIKDVNNYKELNNNYIKSYEPIKEGHKLKYLIVGILGSCSAFLYFYKNEKFRNIFKFNTLYDSIKIFLDKIKTGEYIKIIRQLSVDGMNYFINIFNNSSDTWRLFGIIALTYLFWLIIKIIIMLIIKCRKTKNSKNNGEENIISVN